MISRPEWDRTWIITVISLMVFTPLVVLRIRQSLRQRSSVPAVASAALAAILYISWMLGLEQVWELVPAAIRGFPLPTPILEAACLHVFMVSIASDLPASKLRRRIRAELAVAVVVLVLVIGLAFGGPRCEGPDLYTCNSRPLPHDGFSVTAMLLGSGYVTAVLVHCVWLGFRRADGTPTGRGMGLLAAGCGLYTIVVVHAGFYRQLSPHGRGMAFTDSLAFEVRPAMCGTVLIFVGFVYPPVVMRLRAYRCLRALEPLWALAVARYPDLAPHTHSRQSLHERFSDRVAYLQDAMTLTAQLRSTPLYGHCSAPRALTDHATAVAEWFAEDTVPQLDCRWLTTPESVTDQQWMLAVGAAYSAYADGSSTSGIPSTLRR